MNWSEHPGIMQTEISSHQKPFNQLKSLAIEVSKLVNGRWWRWYSCWFSESLWIVVSYRLDRFCYLLLGRLWRPVRVLLAPMFFMLHPWIRHEIHYQAQIGPGLMVLHPSLGVQVSKTAIIGRNFEMVGGNAIGRRRHLSGDRPVIGDNVQLGMGAIVLGPVRIGDNVRVGAGAVVIHDVPSNSRVGGVPARLLAASAIHSGTAV